MTEKTLLPSKTYLPPLLRTVQCFHDHSIMASDKTGRLDDFEEEIFIWD